VGGRYVNVRGRYVNVWGRYVNVPEIDVKPLGLLFARF